MNLYIFSQVLSDYTEGMAVIAAESMDRCRELVQEKWSSNYVLLEFDDAIKSGSYKVLEVQGQEEGVVSYVFGGG